MIQANVRVLRKVILAITGTDIADDSRDKYTDQARPSR